jgi:hypothetical protein
MIKFKTGGYYGKNLIKEVEVEKETEHFFYIKGSRVKKEGGYEQYHDTVEAAYAYLLENAEKEAITARLNLERANGYLGNIKGMKKP